MKILYIDVNCKNSSTGQIVYSLFSECKKNGCESALAYGRGPKISELNIFKFGLDFETYFHAFMTRITGYTGYFSFFSTKRLLSFIKHFKPDIVHIHELHAYFVNLKPLLKYLKDNRIHTIFTNHCEFLFTGKCGLSKECTKYSANCGKCPLKKSYPSSLLFDHTKKMIEDKRKLLTGWEDAYFVSPSEWLNSKMDISFLNESKRFVINNGIDTSIYKVNLDIGIKSNFGIPNNKKIVMSVAPNIFSENKGGHRFLEIAKKMTSHDNIVFVAVGATEIPNEIPSNVIVLPLIKDKGVLTNLYSIADCFVICSRFDNFPTTCLEAQCCGTKIVGYDVGGVKETILDGHGVVVPFNDSDSASKEIINIIENDYSKEDISMKSKSYFSQERMFGEYLTLYKKMLCD